MHNPLIVIAVVCLYVGLLFMIALWVERGSPKVKQIGKHPLVYSLALAVYCTSWTYYGSVGSAANSGMLFLTIYLGPTMAIVLWWFVMRKLIRIKMTQRITSVADFISARYDKSQALAAIATLLALIGTTPYIALQLKAVTSTFTLITTSDGASDVWIGGNVGPIVVALMIIFTIVMGVRRVDPTERHEGMLVALAVESLVKLAAFLTVGIFITFFVYNGFGDIFQRLSESSFQDMMNVAGRDVSAYLTWMTYLILAMSAIMFLPRQFHIAVVENSNENQLRTAIWLFPLYLFLINIFVVPIAAGGLLQGQPVSEADTFVLGLPLLFNRAWLALVVFIGGFSAATGMIIVSAMTTATMVTNHLMLPLVDRISWLSFLQRYLLRVRWLAVAMILILGYGFEQLMSESYTLVNMGLISFAAVLQFAPVSLGGLFWRQANKAGAILGLSAGFVIWFYTLLLPSFVRSGWLSSLLLEQGPGGISFLNPEHLFGVVGLDPLPHTLFWSLLFNVGFYVLGSLYFEKSETEENLTEMFVDVLTADASLGSFISGRLKIDLADKRVVIERLLNQYFTPPETAHIVERCLQAVGIGIDGKSQVSVTELVKFYNEVEKSLAGAIGSATAYRVFSQAELLTDTESKELSDTYSEILTDLRVSPEDLRRRIDYYRERDILLANQAVELEAKVAERTRALEASARISHQLTTILDVNELLQQVVTLIQDTFGYYHVHIYLIDRNTGELIMREGSGQVGQQLKAAGHKLQPGQGIVGAVANSGQAILAENVDDTPDFFRNPLLPKTRSELAVPIKKVDKVLGVLDMHREQVGGFNQNDLTLLQSIADQVAVVVENARLFRETQTALREVERLNRRLTRDSWSGFSKEVITTGYHFKRGTSQAISPDSDVWLSPMKQAAAKKRLVKQSQIDNGDDSPQTELAVPLILRGEVIGVLGVKREEKPDWAEEEISAVEAVANQVALALENARLSKEQEKTIAQLQDIDRLKSEFLTSMSHELRTPLNSIIGFADVLLQGIDGELNEVALHDIQLIYNSGQHLLALINDILDLSKIEAGKMELICEVLEIKPIVDEVLAATNSLIKKQVKVSVDVSEELPPVYADKLRLNQVLLNLVSNAAKFTTKGTIAISAKVADNQPEQLFISVADSGIGIPQNKLATIFDRFSQVDSSTTRKYGGTGLGLPICQQLIEIHGGQIGVTSEEGVGSTFYFTIPLVKGMVEEIKINMENEY